jgi:hypothetical protein
MERLEPVTLMPSRFLFALEIFLLVLAAIAVMLSGLESLATVELLMALALFECMNFYSGGSKRVAAIACHDNGWKIYPDVAPDNEIPVVPVGQQLATGFLVVIHLEDYRGCSYRLPVVPDMLGNDEFRRLRAAVLQLSTHYF